MQESKTQTILDGYDDLEKGAYLGAIASIATADRSASQEEIDHLRDLAEAASLSKAQTDAVLHAATELSPDQLQQCLDRLKTSDLRFSLVADLIAFAEVDNEYSEEERKNIEQIAQYLGLTDTQTSLLDQFVHKSAKSNVSPQDIGKPGFLESLGLKDQFSNAGINLGSMGKGLLGFLGPMLLGGMLGRMGSRRPGGFGASRSGPSPGGFGGLGSIISALGGSQRRRLGGGSALGGVLGKIFR